MGNTNFQTIHQMGTAISNMVKQATGRDAVQNIDMEHVTVAQNHRYEEVDVSGRVVSFYAGEAGLPFEKMVVQIKPVQDLHGYDHPWPAGGGVNKFDEYVFSNYGGVLQTSGVWHFDSLVNVLNKVLWTAPESIGQINVTMWRKQRGVGSQGLRLSINYTDGTSVKVGDQNATGGTDVYSVTTNASKTVRNITGDYGSNQNSTDVNVVVSIGSTAPPAYSPYSNICPITGWTMVNVYQSGQNMEDARVYRFTFPSEAGIVYGGTLDVISGVMTVDMAEVDLGTLNWFKSSSGSNFYAATPEYNKAGTEGKFVCSQYRFDGFVNSAEYYGDNGTFRIWGVSGIVYEIYIHDDSYSDAASFKAALTASNAQLVYELATPITYQLAPQEITTLLGTNNIWADTGDIEVKFTNVKELY